MGGKLSKRKKGYDVSDPKEKQDGDAATTTAVADTKSEVPPSEQAAGGGGAEVPGKVDVSAEPAGEAAAVSQETALLHAPATEATKEESATQIDAPTMVEGKDSSGPTQEPSVQPEAGPGLSRVEAPVEKRMEEPNAAENVLTPVLPKSTDKDCQVIQTPASSITTVASVTSCHPEDKAKDLVNEKVDTPPAGAALTSETSMQPEEAKNETVAVVQASITAVTSKPDATDKMQETVAFKSNTETDVTIKTADVTTVKTSNESEKVTPEQVPVQPVNVDTVQKSTTEPEKVDKVQTSTTEREKVDKVQTSTTEPEKVDKVHTSTTEPEKVDKVQTSINEPEKVGTAQTSINEPEKVDKVQTSTIDPEKVGTAQTSTIEPEKLGTVQTSTTEPEKVGTAQTSTTEPEKVGTAQKSTIEPEKVIPSEQVPVQAEKVGVVQASTTEPEKVIPSEQVPVQAEKVGVVQASTTEPEKVIPSEQVPVQAEKVGVVQASTTEPEKVIPSEQVPLQAEKVGVLQASTTEPEKMGMVQTSTTETQNVTPSEQVPLQADVTMAQKSSSKTEKVTPSEQETAQTEDVTKVQKATVKPKKVTPLEEVPAQTEVTKVQKSTSKPEMVLSASEQATEQTEEVTMVHSSITEPKKVIPASEPVPVQSEEFITTQKATTETEMVIASQQVPVQTKEVTTVQTSSVSYSHVSAESVVLTEKRGPTQVEDASTVLEKHSPVKENEGDTTGFSETRPGEQVKDKSADSIAGVQKEAIPHLYPEVPKIALSAEESEGIPQIMISKSISTNEIQEDELKQGTAEVKAADSSVEFCDQETVVHAAKAEVSTESEVPPNECKKSTDNDAEEQVKMENGECEANALEKEVRPSTQELNGEPLAHEAALAKPTEQQNKNCINGIGAPEVSPKEQHVLNDCELEEGLIKDMQVSASTGEVVQALNA